MVSDAFCRTVSWYRLRCLNPCCNGRWSLTEKEQPRCSNQLQVLILVVMEDGLWRKSVSYNSRNQWSLNPCCNGRWSLTSLCGLMTRLSLCLNPCCNGRWSLTLEREALKKTMLAVLILVVMEDGLWHMMVAYIYYEFIAVLILVVMEDGLWRQEGDQRI